MECVIQSSMFYSSYLCLSILLCNVDSALVSDSSDYIWISNCIQMFELYSNVWIYIRMLKECVFSACSRKMAFSDDISKKISQLYQELVNAYKTRFMCENGQVPVVKCSPLWENMRKDFRTFPDLISSSFSNRSIEAGKKRNYSRKWNPCLRWCRTCLDKRMTIMTCFAL